MEMTLNNSFLAIENNDLELINGGINWDRVFTGISIAGAALLGIAGIVTTPLWVPTLGCFLIGTAVGYYLFY
ncbi:hypothetical protein [Clostridium sp. D43t1_170807_H7]|uniref:hypothetical protein n=1 Tax=Clostridium sp. D43t1_170807_H7 TaxID=2787140 RepID=UPI00189A4889|nr:hypothetical protein [Clostridium sp. D43t1_170807_H7]